MDKNSKIKLNPFLGVFFKTQIIQISVFILMFLIFAFIIYSVDDFSSELYFYIISFVTAFTNFISGFYTGIKIKKNGLLNALIICLPTNLAVYTLSLFLNSFKIDLTMLFSAVIAVSASMLGGVLSVNRKTKIR